MRAPRYKCDAASPSIIWRLEHAAKAHVGGEEKLRSEGGCAPLRGDLLEAFDNIVADLDLRSAADRERVPRSPGHAFYDRLRDLLREAGFDAFVEGVCKPYYAPRMGAPSLPPGRYFRMHMIGYFEGIDSERGIAWRCADSFSLRDFLRLSNREKVPDHSWLSRTRSRLPHEAHETVFGWVLKLVAERGLVKGERIGVDGSTMEANAALRTIVRRDSGESYRAMLTRMAQESGIETPTAEDLARFDRKRKGKTLSNAEVSIELARAADAEITVLYVSPSKIPPNGTQQRRRPGETARRGCAQGDRRSRRSL